MSLVLLPHSLIEDGREYIGDVIGGCRGMW